jgi:MYXO-CTERM domain-containing protein
MRVACVLVPTSLLVVALAVPGTAHAAPVWVGDFETGDLSQWSYLLNSDVNGMTYSQADTELVAQGTYAGRIELHNDAVWGNGLKRVELQHAPAPGRTAEGQTTYFAWSFYLPEALPVDPAQQIGYWESNQSFQQMMAFDVAGERITFSTRRPDNVVQWEQDGAATPGQWHRIAMGITWSTSVDVGRVDVWFDGDPVVTAAAAQTLADGNDHFTQVGLLRGQIEFADVPVIYIDDAVEGDSLEDVHPELDPGGGTTGTGSEGGGSGDVTGSEGGGDSSGGGPGPTTMGTTDPDATTAGPITSGVDTATAGGGTGSSSGSPADDDGAGGCGCRGAAAPIGATWGWAGLAALVGRRRRRAT